MRTTRISRPRRFCCCGSGCESVRDRSGSAIAALDPLKGMAALKALAARETPEAREALEVRVERVAVVARDVPEARDARVAPDVLYTLDEPYTLDERAKPPERSEAKLGYALRLYAGSAAATPASLVRLIYVRFAFLKRFRAMCSSSVSSESALLYLRIRLLGSIVSALPAASRCVRAGCARFPRAQVGWASA